jgi:hypothetical protein
MDAAFTNKHAFTRFHDPAASEESQISKSAAQASIGVPAARKRTPKPRHSRIFARIRIADATIP